MAFDAVDDYGDPHDLKKDQAEEIAVIEREHWWTFLAGTLNNTIVKAWLRNQYAHGVVPFRNTDGYDL